MKSYATLILLLFTFSFSNAQINSSSGTEFWLGYMENLDLLFNPSPQFSIYVSAKESGSGQVIAAATGLTFDFEYEANTVTEFTLPTGIYYAEGSEFIANLGLKITSSTEVSIYAIHYRPFFSEGTMLLPIESLTSQYTVSAALDFNNFADAASSFLVVATEDNTTVEITPSQNTLGLRPKDVTFTVEMDAGNSYQVQALADLTGSLITTSNGEKIAVFGGAQRGNIGCELADNHIYDQVQPKDQGGKSFAFVPFIGQVGSIFKITALEDATEIFLDDDFQTTLNENETYEIELTNPTMMTSSENVQCTQLSKSFNCSVNDIGDPNMIMLQPLGYEIENVYFPNLDGFEFNTSAFTNQYVNLISETKNIEMVSLDDIDIDWSPFENNLDYSYAQILLSPGTSHLVALEGVQAFAYGFGDYDAYSFHLGFIPEEDPNAIVNKTENKLFLGPNPSQDNIYLKSEEHILQYKISSLDGSVLSINKVNSKKTTIDISNLHPAAYILQITTKSGNSDHKIIKM